MGGVFIFLFCLAWSVGVAWWATNAIIAGEMRGKVRHDGKPQPVATMQANPIEFWATISFTYGFAVLAIVMGTGKLREGLKNSNLPTST